MREDVKDMKKIFILLLCLAVVMVISVGCGSAAKKDMDSAVDTANVLLQKDAKAYDPTTKTDLKKAVKASDDANDDSAYKKSAKAIKVATKAYKNSIKQLKQVTNPKESFIIERAKTVKTITQVEAATEKTDENNMMNKKGGYTSYIALKSSMVTDSYYANQSALKAGNDGGGAIEAFKTVKDAKARDEYLSTFDGSGMLAPGTHKVVGTLVVRTSNELKASQQKKLEKWIVDSLIKLDE